MSLYIEKMKKGMSVNYENATDEVTPAASLNA